MSRIIRLTIAYDGGHYHGWQRQHNGRTIQGEIERQLAVLCRHPVSLHGAGRTDAGVHALAMVAHFHTHTGIPLVAFHKGLNSLLPTDIRILQADDVPDSFHSRFSALGKTYRYDFCTATTQLPHQRLYCAHFPGTFQLPTFNSATQYIIGTHDFSSFERAGSRDKSATNGRGAVRTLFRVQCQPHAVWPHCWSLRFTGDGFLRQMVRILSGTLIDIGTGRQPPESLLEILSAQDRRAAGLTAPACGLFLEHIYYNSGDLNALLHS